MTNEIVVVRGGGDIASGTIQKLHRAGFKVLVLETDKPTTIRRKVAFSEAVYDGRAIVEDMKGVLTKSEEDIYKVWENGNIPVAIDKEGILIHILKPIAVVDAILAKKNLGTNLKMAPITIGLGPGFNAGIDVNVVIETMRGHSLGRIIFNGPAIENTGVPGEIGNYTTQRVIYSPYEGMINNKVDIGKVVQSGDVLAEINGHQIVATISGVLRGIIRDKFYITKGLKIADIDPRYDEIENCNTISDKARCIGGGVLEALIYLKRLKK